MNLNEINNLIQRANALLKTNWLQAVYILQEALKEEPDNLSSLLTLVIFIWNANSMKEPPLLSKSNFPASR